MPLDIAQVSEVGFTGTRKGMTAIQKVRFRDLLIEISISPGPKWMNNGLAIGSDEECAVISYELGFRIRGWPGQSMRGAPSQQSLIALELCNVIEPVYSYSGRNQRIVLASQLMIATPKSMTRKGGTWNAIGHAERMRVPLVIIEPSGSVVEIPAIQHYP